MRKNTTFSSINDSFDKIAIKLKSIKFIKFFDKIYITLRSVVFYKTGMSQREEEGTCDGQGNGRKTG